ncbi:hypothetical protein, partial [Streptomyces sp. NPDC001450]
MVRWPLVCGEVGLDDDAVDAERQLCTYGGDLLDPSQDLLRGVGDDVRDGGPGAGVHAEFGVSYRWSLWAEAFSRSARAGSVSGTGSRPRRFRLDHRADQRKMPAM